MELAVKFPVIKQIYFTSGVHIVKSKAFANYFETSDFIQHSRCCIEILDAIPLTATGEGANFKLEN